jgi:hypothetical protein
MGIIETQLKHVGYELDMLVYTFDKLLLVERLVERSFQGGQVNALIEAFCIHARNLDEFFQGSGRADTLKAQTFADRAAPERQGGEGHHAQDQQADFSSHRAAHLCGRGEDWSSGSGQALFNPDR